MILGQLVREELDQKVKSPTNIEKLCLYLFIKHIYFFSFIYLGTPVPLDHVLQLVEDQNNIGELRESEEDSD